jgi:NAD(P)-dependent dehydrogenase (short-subunit alcohol dehydrogenase family)
MTFALSHLGYFLLTGLLIDRLRASAPARIVNVSSVSHRGVELDFTDLQHRRRYRPYRVHARSKLANLLFTSELARRLEGTGVTATVADPGLVSIRIGSNNGWVGRLATTLLHLRYRSNSVDPAEGARTAAYLASSPEVEGISGRYFAQSVEVDSAPASRDADAARRLWGSVRNFAGLPSEGAGRRLSSCRRLRRT